MTFDTNTNKAYECPICHGHNCEFDDAENHPSEGYFDGAHLPATFFCNDCGRAYTVAFTLRAEKSTPDGAVTFVVEVTHGATAGQPGSRWWESKHSSTLAQARADLAEVFTNKIAVEDRGEAYKREWSRLVEQAKAARPGEVFAFDEFAARITEQKEG
jgi:hypothetical protein